MQHSFLSVSTRLSISYKRNNFYLIVILHDDVAEIYDVNSFLPHTTEI